MKKLRKAPLAAAVAAALFSGLVGATAQTIDPALTGLGQIVVYPYYTVNEGWQTLINLTNVTDKALAIKLRVHEAQNSRDVLDINVLMSPRDVWVASLSATADGGAVMNSEDTTCTSPLQPKAGWLLNKVGYAGDGGDQGIGRLTEGYVEVIVMGECDMTHTEGCNAEDTGIGWLTKHVKGEPRDCAAADRYFVAKEGWDFKSIPGSGNPIAAGDGTIYSRGYDPSVTVQAPLKGNLSVVNVLDGTGSGNDALAYPIVYLEGYTNLVTAQEFPYFLEPTVATAWSGQLWNAQLLNSAEGVISAAGAINEWSDNPVNGVRTDWVLNFPTKGYHVDQDCSDIQASNNKYRYDGVTTLTCASINTGDDPRLTSKDYSYVKGYGKPDGSRADAYPPSAAPFAKRWTGKSDVAVTLNIWDREELGVVSHTVPSPNPPKQWALPFESTVITLGSNGSALASSNPVVVDPGKLLGNGAVSGWARIDFDNAPYGLPAIGFMMKTRKFADNPDKNNGAMINHAWTIPTPDKD